MLGGYSPSGITAQPKKKYKLPDFLLKILDQNLSVNEKFSSQEMSY